MAKAKPKKNTVKITTAEQKVLTETLTSLGLINVNLGNTHILTLTRALTVRNKSYIDALNEGDECRRILKSERLMFARRDDYVMAESHRHEGAVSALMQVIDRVCRAPTGAVEYALAGTVERQDCESPPADEGKPWRTVEVPEQG